MLPTSKVNITSFSKLVQVPRTENKYRKKTVIKVNQRIFVDILIFVRVYRVYMVYI